GSMSFMALTLGIGLGAGDVFAQDVLPKPEPAFHGTIGKTYKDSKPDFPKPLQAPADAPNVLIVLLKETGSGRVGIRMSFRYSVEPFDIGRDTVSAVSKDYQPPFAFNGRIEQVTIETK
ncbi:MAG: hypothetical protein WBO24_05635, partial [Nitrospirales bacterium]